MAQFYSAAKGVKTNQKECEMLSRRVQQVEQLLKHAQPTDSVAGAVSEVERIVAEATEFVTKLQGRGIFAATFKQGSDGRKLKELGEQLTAAVNDKAAAEVSEMRGEIAEILETLRNTQGFSADMDQAAAEDTAAAE